MKVSIIPIYFVTWKLKKKKIKKNSNEQTKQWSWVCVEAQRPPPTIETTRHPCPRRTFVGVITHPLGLQTGTIPESDPSIAAIRRFAQLGKAGKRGQRSHMNGFFSNEKLPQDSTYTLPRIGKICRPPQLLVTPTVNVSLWDQIGTES